MTDIETLAREAGKAVAEAFANVQPTNDTAFTEEWFELWHSYRS